MAQRFGILAPKYKDRGLPSIRAHRALRTTHAHQGYRHRLAGAAARKAVKVASSSGTQSM